MVLCREIDRKDPVLIYWNEDSVTRFGIGRSGIAVEPSQVIHAHLVAVRDGLQGFISVDDGAFAPEVRPRDRHDTRLPAKIVLACKPGLAAWMASIEVLYCDAIRVRLSPPLII